MKRIKETISDFKRRGGKVKFFPKNPKPPARTPVFPRGYNQTVFQFDGSLS